MKIESGARTIVLRTACGCEQMRAWPEPLPPEIVVPLRRQPSTVAVGRMAELPGALDVVTTRRFVRRVDENCVPVYWEFE